MAAYPELSLVVVAAVVGLVVPRPWRALDAHQGIDVLLAVLVASTAYGVSLGELAQVRRTWRAAASVLVVGATVLPALTWLVARLAAAGPLREGIASIGLAPCEIASVATTGIAGGDAATAAAILVGSTAVTVGIAGPVLSLESPAAHVHPAHIVVDLVLVVALPFLAGVALRAVAEATSRREAGAARAATASLALLVALVTAEIHPTVRYVPVVVASVVVVAASAVVGVALARPGSARAGVAVLLTTSMRDFAIAAGLAAAAFGPAAAAPLGVYGVVVIVWGTAAAGRLRQRAGSG